MAIRVGTCAFSDHEGFYPPGLPAGERLAHYAQRFPLVEIDATFYGLPRPETVAHWIRRTPPGFVIDVKAERRMTGHARPLGLAERLAACAQFGERLRPLGEAGRMGHVLLQFPPWLRRSAQALEEIARLRAALGAFRVSVEMRHRSWYQDGGAELLSTLRALDAAHVVADEPQAGQGSVPLVPSATSGTAIMRLHGRNRETWYVRGGSSQERFFYLYAEEELQGLATVARGLAAAAAEVHVLLNNNHRDFAVRNALRLQTILGGAGAAPPPQLFA